MPTHVALLRGINVGGRNTVAMADLRDIVTALGHADVTTYIQSGNVLFSRTDVFRSTDVGKRTDGCKGAGDDTRRLAEEIEQGIATRLGMHPSVIVLSRGQLGQVIEGNPYPQADPRRLHAVFRREPLGERAIAAVATAVQKARGKGSPDEVTVVGPTLYLFTPNGFGRSELVAQLGRASPATITGEATARNWATVTKLMSLLEE